MTYAAAVEWWDVAWTAAVIVFAGAAAAALLRLLRVGGRWLSRHIAEDVRREFHDAIIEDIDVAVTRIAQPWIVHMESVSSSLKLLQDHQTEHAELWAAIAALGGDRRRSHRGGP